MRESIEVLEGNGDDPQIDWTSPWLRHLGVMGATEESFQHERSHSLQLGKDDLIYAHIIVAFLTRPRLELIERIGMKHVR